jgi:hypothetical protein
MHACGSTLASSSSIIALISGTPYLVTTTSYIVLLIIRYIIRSVWYVIGLKRGLYVMCGCLITDSVISPP